MADSTLIAPLADISNAILAAPGWARIGITMPDERMRERAAEALAQSILERVCGGGPRDVATLFPNLEIWTKLPEGPVVLVDDVVTSGGHALACAKILREYGHEVDHVLSVAHTVHERPAAGMFSIAPYDLEAPPTWACDF